MATYLIVSVPDKNSHHATAHLWKVDALVCSLIFTAPVVIGKEGVAATISDVSTKVEGDHKTPLGKFRLTKIYYRADKVLITSLLPNQAITQDLHCIDDPLSSYYNKVTSDAQMPVSAEKMWREDELYNIVVDTSYNIEGNRGKGSCIFLHSWRSDKEGTEGCVALSTEALKLAVQLFESESYLVVQLLNS